MNEKLKQYKEKVTTYYASMSKKQKTFLFGGLGVIIAILIIVAVLTTTRNDMVALYKDLSVQEVGQITEELDARGVSYEITDAGTGVKVPQAMADSLLVDLAAQGIPDSGNIDYSFFAENSSWGITDNEFEVMKLDAMQTELANLITKIDGINGAEVNLNIPKEPVFVSEQSQPSTASIVIQTAPGYQFEPSQVNGLYQLVAKSIPNLSTDDIVIMNQHFEYFDLNDNRALASGDSYTSQQQIKGDIEKDIERNVQKMLGSMIGMNKVAISATADVDFTQEQRVEEIIEPVDEDNDTLPVSIETITESFTGAQPEEGAAGVGDGEVANYPAGLDGNVGDYELVKESVNNEFNRIQRDIVESPYKIRDLGIQVAIDNTRTLESGEMEQLSAQEQADVEQSVASILDSIISTSIDKTYEENITPDDKVSIVFQPFEGTDTIQTPTVNQGIPTWVYVVGGGLLVAIIILLWMLRRRKASTNEEAEQAVQTVEVDNQEQVVPPIAHTDDSDAAVRRKQLEKYAQDKPEEFAKLLRSWITED
ncbi:flagellar basal-body MS-ring/collar protein FliF [Gracilibacillus sp. S3-1-1]|uniref:Flagellar basal-body MS-ring/collar protein FliF n=1 Tax=Gracilibacillus pellucidus TaxID=3095368 RepID=A0ACC6M7L8_9BACI|nr:flagellar basal-body MS-ring/collar protein FliF [Gracilibacillus sp. S3-1-1]MDX8046934.1 flagellar basal-body MS-ring/collar protein FliF [Gracilibacillus sp. S3-1-1]